MEGRIEVRGEERIEEWLLPVYLFAVSGWLWEAALTGIEAGQFVNRGFLHGPWLPVYGIGGILLMALSRRHSGGRLFVLSALAGGAVEFIGGTILENVYHYQWWSYAGWPGAVGTRVCLVTMAVYGILGVSVFPRLGPWLGEQFDGVHSGVRTFCCRMLSVVFATDLVFSVFSPNIGPWIATPL